MIGILGFGYILMCANTLCAGVQELADLLKCFLLLVLKKTELKISLTFNGWTNHHMVYYIVDPLHWVSEESVQRISGILNFFEVLAGAGVVGQIPEKFSQNFYQV